MSIAIALSGGGAKGDFQVGVLRYLYDQGIRPDILCSTSVGSVNAIKLAEGEDPGNPTQGLSGLETSWAGLMQNSDMFEEEAWLNDPDLLPSIRNLLTGHSDLIGISAPIHSMQQWGDIGFVVNLVQDLGWLTSEGVAILKSLEVIAKRARAIFNLSPVVRRMDSELDSTKVAAWASRGGKLRIGIVGLQCGLLRYVTEAGNVIETDGTIAAFEAPPQGVPIECQSAAAKVARLETSISALQESVRLGNKGAVGVIKGLITQRTAATQELAACIAIHTPPDTAQRPPLLVPFASAVIASSSIPGIFPPVTFGGESYIDSGIREVLPLQAAVDLGASIIYAVSASQPHLNRAPEGFGNAGVDKIVARSLTEIAIHEVALNDFFVRPAPGKTLPDVLRIFPVQDVHEMMTIDPGLVQISCDYGYMRAADAVGRTAESSRRAVLATDIMDLRRAIWSLENKVAGQPDPRRLSEPPSAPEPGLASEVAEAKRQLQLLINERMALGGPMPGSMPYWVSHAERHPWAANDPGSVPIRSYVVAFHANTTNLWTVGADNVGDRALGVMGGTSPSVAALTGGGYVVAFQANTGNLWIVGGDNIGDRGLGMMAGTSPAIAALPNGGYVVAFQANTGNLWTVGGDNIGDRGLGMMAGTSPAIAALPNGGYVVAFQANTGNLWTVGGDNIGDRGLGMMAGTSPAIAALPNGGYVVAFQANTGNLWTVGGDNIGDRGLGMMAGTNPGIAALTGGGYVVAFQANTGNLWTVGVDSIGDRGLGMMAGTSPGIAALPGGGYEVAFQANTGNLWTVGADNVGDRGLGMMAGTTPGIAR